MDISLCVKGLKKGAALMHIPLHIKRSKEIIETALDLNLNLNELSLIDNEICTIDICQK